MRPQNKAVLSSYCHYKRCLCFVMILPAFFCLLTLMGCSSGAATPSKPSYVVFTAATPDNPSHTEVYIARADGSSVRQLTHEADGADFPTISPDKIRVVYQTIKYPNRLSIINVDGSNPHTLLSLPDTAGANTSTVAPSYPAFSPDSSLIALSVSIFGANLIYTIHPDGSHFAPVFSPDSALASQSFRPVYAPNGVILFNTFFGGIGSVNRDGTNAHILLANPPNPPSPNGEIFFPSIQTTFANPSFSPDGTTIVFQSTQYHNQMINIDIMLANADGSNIRPLVQGGLLQYPAFTPDGKQIVYQDQNGLQIINRDGSNPRAFLGSRATLLNPQHAQFR